MAKVVEPGLSPRVRGNLPSGRMTGSAARSIPACAGEPPSPNSTGGRKGVYPRVCGGTFMVLYLLLIL